MKVNTEGCGFSFQDAWDKVEPAVANVNILSWHVQLSTSELHVKSSGAASGVVVRGVSG